MFIAKRSRCRCAEHKKIGFAEGNHRRTTTNGMSIGRTTTQIKRSITFKALNEHSGRILQRSYEDWTNGPTNRHERGNDKGKANKDQDLVQSA